MSLRHGEQVFLVDGSGQVLGTARFEELDSFELGSPERVIPCHRYSGPFQPTSSWDTSEAKTLLGQLDDAINSNSFSGLDDLQDQLFDRGVRLHRAVDGATLTALSLLLYDGSTLEWMIERFE